jgi:histidinol phosphatase-like PHP family hydrolase
MSVSHAHVESAGEYNSHGREPVPVFLDCQRLREVGAFVLVGVGLGDDAHGPEMLQDPTCSM